MILFALFANFIFSKVDSSIFHLVSLHYSNFSINFGKKTMQNPIHLTISPSCFHPKYEFHNLRSIKSFNPFIFSNQFARYDLSLSNCHFLYYLSPVIYQNSEDYQQLVDTTYDSNSKAELNAQMKQFSNSDRSSINIFNCIFQDITGDRYDGDIAAVLCLITSNNGGSITISDSQFHRCKPTKLQEESNIGGALYISTKGNQQSSVILQNLIFTECNAFTGAAFVINSNSPVNYTEISCRNINISNFINLPTTEYYDSPRNVVDVQNCLIKQFANILFENMDNEKFLTNLLSFSNCDGKVSSLQFTNITFPQSGDFIYPMIQVSQSDGYSHTLIFEGLGFQSATNAIPVYLQNSDTNNELTVIIDNFYYPDTNYLYVDGNNISTSISITYTETSGINIITPSPTATESPTASISESPYPTVTETPEPSPIETPYATLTETPTETPTVSESPVASTTPPPTSTPMPPKTDFPSTLYFSPSDDFDKFGPNSSDRNIKGNNKVGLIVGCTIAAIVVVVAVILIILFCCMKKVPCCNCCEKTAFEPSDEESKTELCFFDETLNQAH